MIILILQPGEGRFKVAMSEDPELTSGRHTESPATYGTFASEKDLKASCAAPAHQAEENEAVWK